MAPCDKEGSLIFFGTAGVQTLCKQEQGRVRHPSPTKAPKVERIYNIASRFIGSKEREEKKHRHAIPHIFFALTAICCESKSAEEGSSEASIVPRWRKLGR